MTISETAPIYRTSVTAEVVGVYQKEERPVTTLLVRPFTIEVEGIGEAHLGDEAAIEISFSIHSMNLQQILRREL